MGSIHYTAERQVIDKIIDHRKSKNSYAHKSVAVLKAKYQNIKIKNIENYLQTVIKIQTLKWYPNNECD